MLRFVSVVLAAAMLLGCAGTDRILLAPPPPLSTLSVASSSELKSQIDALLVDSLFPPSNIGVKVVSLTRNKELYALNEHMLFNPASNQKLFTSAAALHFLGTTATVPTTVAADTTSNRIIITGFGDPILSTADLDSLAGSCAMLLPPGRTWDVAVDTRFFDSLYWGAGWTWDEEPEAYGMFLSPLMLNNNTITVDVIPASTPGDPPWVLLDPPTAYTPVENTAVTIADSVIDPLRVSRKWQERLNTITVQGQMGITWRTRRDQLSVWRPELYAGTVFAERLRNYGVATNRVTIDSLHTDLPPLITFEHGIDTILTFLNKVSDNLSAEAMLKTIAARRHGAPGSARGGVSLVYEFLSQAGVDTNAIAIADGSGLSRYNLTSTSTIIRLLKHMYADSASFPLFYKTLPIAGVDGTIGRRMQGTLAQGNLRAKTGTLSGVTALSGYVQTLEGEWLAFSVLMQNHPGSSRVYRNVQDGIGAVLAGIRKAY
ncbi:MAG: D-alanyl-D-alanine carboxypeptidase/D-alanyl-D-alanine-endopeptidase [Bacteroidetes bacterium]|nr:D-alanyl-D-alanine carboxypeptidase/D-alanyl-D-alanine-endopeptidase [Bacteroidota bacterium]